MFGSVKVILKVSQGKSYSDTVHLCLGDCTLRGVPVYKDAATEFKVGANQYVAILRGVESKNKVSFPNEVQRVSLVVESK